MVRAGVGNLGTSAPEFLSQHGMNSSGILGTEVHSHKGAIVAHPPLQINVSAISI